MPDARFRSWASQTGVVVGDVEAAGGTSHSTPGTRRRPHRPTRLGPGGSGPNVNTSEPGGHISTTWYDLFGNVAGELTAGNRKRALDASPNDSAKDVAEIATRLADSRLCRGSRP